MKMGFSQHSVRLKEVKMLRGSAFRSPRCMNTSTTMPTITKSTIIWRSPGVGKEELQPAIEAKEPRKREKKPRKRKKKLRKLEKKLGGKERRRGCKRGKVGMVERAK